MIEETAKISRLAPHPRRTSPGAPPGSIVIDPEAPAPHISIMAYGPGSLEERSGVSVSAIEEFRGSYPVLWVDVQALGDESVLRWIGERFGLHSLSLEDVVNVHQRPKVEEYDEYLFIVGRIPHADHHIHTEQISLFLGPDFVVTFQERPGDCFESVRSRLRTSRGHIRTGGADYLSYALLDAATDAYFPILEEVGERIDTLEDVVMAAPQPDDVKRIHALKRDLLTVRRAVWPQRDMLSQLVRDEHPLVDAQTRIYLRDCFDHTFQLIDLIETYRETISDLTDIFLSSQSARMNEIMKVLTIIATIFMPLTLISSIYGMNFDTRVSGWNMPELGWAFGYPAALVVMAGIAVGMMLYFRRRGWLGRTSGKRGRR